MVEDVTDRQFAYDALRESEARLQAFTSHSPALMSLKDGEGRYRFVNDRFLQRFGLRREQVHGAQGRAALLARRRRARFARADEEVLARGVADRSTRTRLPARRRRALQHGVEIPGVRRRRRGGRASARVATDITERKLAEQALREQRTLLAEAQKLAGLGCWEWDPASGRVSLVRRDVPHLRREPGAFRPSLRELPRAHPSGRTAPRARGDGGARPDGQSAPSAWTSASCGPTAQVRQLRSHGEVVRDEAGRPLKMVGACIDVTEQKMPPRRRCAR